MGTCSTHREGNGNPLQYSCLENPRDGGAWWAAVYEVAQSQTRLKWLSSSSSTRPFRTNTQKRCPFHYRGLECKSRKSRNTWSNRQIWPRNTKWSRAKLTEFCQENALVIANTLFQQHKIRFYTWTSPDGQYQNQIDYVLCRILFSPRWRSSIQSTKTRPGADYGSDHELLITKFRLKLKKVGKTTRPFRYLMWYQIPYDYTVEVRNRLKGLDLTECLMNYGWRFLTLYRRQGSRPSPWKRNAKKQNGCLGRPYK